MCLIIILFLHPQHQAGEGHEKSSRWEAGVDKPQQQQRSKDNYDSQDRAYAQVRVGYTHISPRPPPPLHTVTSHTCTSANFRHETVTHLHHTNTVNVWQNLRPKLISSYWMNYCTVDITYCHVIDSVSFSSVHSCIERMKSWNRK